MMDNQSNGRRHHWQIFWLPIVLSLAIGSTGSWAARAQTRTYATVGDLRAEVARRLGSVEGILKVSPDPKDHAVIFVTINDDRIESIEVDVTNLYGRILNLSSSQREAEMRRYVRMISTHILKSL